VALALAGAAITAAPASAAVSYMVTHTIHVGGNPHAVAVDSAAGTAYVISDDDTVSVISESSHRVTGTIRVGRLPEGVAVDPAAARST